MTCRACGAIIAAKAIVCYKCGTPTADVAEVPRKAATSRPVLPLLLVAVGVTALGAWLIPKTPDGTWMRWAAWAAVPAIVYLAARLIRGPRSSRLRRP